MTSTSGSNLPEDLLAHLNKQLEDGEVVVWAGQSSSAALQKKFSVITPVGVVIALFGVVIAVFGRTNHDPVPTYVSGGVFLLIGFFVARLASTASRKAKNAVYAVTNKRAILMFSAGVDRVTSFLPQDFGPIQTKDNKDGTGDVTFYKPAPEYSKPGTRPLAFMAIPDPQAAEAALRNLVGNGGPQQGAAIKFGPK